MSLVGSLEDLGLGDILQIITLSRKSGILRLRSENGEGSVLFRQGLICSATLKGGPTDLRELVVRKGLLSAPPAEAAWEEARARRLSFGSLLVRQGILGPDQLDALRREHTESAVLEMFRWPSGDFSFEIEESAGAEETDLLLEAGINPQFLALECTRLRDEEEARGERTEQPGARAGFCEEELLAPELEMPEPEKALPEEPPPDPVLPPVIVVDDDLRGLEWTKEILARTFPRVHIFQRTELGIARIRQYLARAELPLVLLSGCPTPDPITGASGFRAIRKRLAVQARSMRVLRYDVRPPEAHGGEDGFVRKPDPGDLADPRREARLEELARALEGQVLEAARGEAPDPVDPLPSP